MSNESRYRMALEAIIALRDLGNEFTMAAIAKTALEGKEEPKVTYRGDFRDEPWAPR